MTSNFISGWDIGGAHLKVARCSTAGELLEVIQIPCPLWQGIDALEQAILTAHQKLNNYNDITAVTMTGELVDIFPHRQAGVRGILECFARNIAIENTHVFAGDKGWLSPDIAIQFWDQVASRNWQASATYAAQQVKNGLFIDIGSTTCDIIPLNNGIATPQGFDDHHRLQTRELVYTGVIRTPLIALANTIPFNGSSMPLVAEVFATTGDCWILLEQLSSKDIQDNSADGMSWTKENCARRIARLLGTDAMEANDAEWQNVAHWFSQKQTQQITDACQLVLSKHPHLNGAVPIIGAGVGRFIAQACAQNLGRDYIDFSELTTPDSALAADHAPAVATALLAAQQLA